MFTSILVATLFTAVSALHVDPLANSSSSLDSDNGGRLRARAICGANDWIEAKCARRINMLDPTEAEQFGWSHYYSQAVLRISWNSNPHCTGFLVGDRGHILTNWHCAKSSYNAKQLKFEAMAEGATCGTNCQSPMGCAGKVIHKPNTISPIAFIATGGSDDNNADWTLLQLPGKKVPKDAAGNNLPYLRIRRTGAVVGERVYSAGHPNGWGKRISLKGPGGFAKIVQSENGYAAFNVDMQGGSSGSPVLSFEGNVVVAIAARSNCLSQYQSNVGPGGNSLYASLSGRSDLGNNFWA
jgi:V8-like Glu-specific endopeptidase